MKRGHHQISKGDYVKLRKSGREKLKRNSGVDVLPSDVFKVINKKFAEGTKKYLITLSIKGKNANFYFSDVIYVS